MQDKQKVTLYLPPELHRQLKIRSAVDVEPMSAIAERALIFYLNHADVVEEVESSVGKTHRVYECPECTSAVILRDSELIKLGQQPGVVVTDDISVNPVQPVAASGQEGEEELVPC